jgi:predicted heme/steroid binding protein
MKKFTEKELSEYDGTETGKPVYFAYKGKVYDATGSPLFEEGMHFEHPAGCDLTDYIEEAPHGEGPIDELTVVGEYEG